MMMYEYMKYEYMVMLDNVRNIHISMNDVLDMLDAVYSNMMIMMIA